VIFVLVQTDVGVAARVAADAAAIPGVIVADDVTGPYDVVVQATDERVLPALQKVPGVTRTLTLTTALTRASAA